MKHIWLFVSLTLGLAACSKVENGPKEDAVANSAIASQSAPSASASDTADHPPGIDPNVAPGVAFDFRYGFSLPERQIASVQEQHAALCGRLGALHCRVTGLHFDKAPSGAVNADITFKLDPALALSFAKDATALVERADGKLATSKVAGEDVGKDIVAGDKSADGIRAELAKLDAQLRIPGLSREARGHLVEQSASLRAELKTLGTARDAKIESLATTPVAFEYEVAPSGFVFGEPLKQGLGASTTSLSALLSFLALGLGAVGPWALLLGGAWWAYRRLRRKPVVTAD